MLCRRPSSSKSVMQWIKYKKEERMEVVAKVIGAVRLGLVDIKDVIAELSSEGMQRVPEIQALVSQALLHNHMPSPAPNLLLSSGIRMIHMPSFLAYI